MIKQHTTLLFSFIVFSALLVGTLFFGGVRSVQAAFDPLEKPCASPNSANSDVCKEDPAAEDPLNGPGGIFTKAVNILSFLAGIVAVIIIIIAGITMMTSQGESNKIKSSRDAIIYAAIGIAVIVLARTIVIFVFNKLQ